MYTTSSLYKLKYKHDPNFRQAERREELLQEQKLKRSELVDNLRQIDSTEKSADGSSRPYYKLQLSEWLYGVPNDLSKWYIRPCPKGRRCMVIAMNGKTSVYNKYGAYVKEYQSKLPSGNKNGSITVLDCIYVPELKKNFILDVIAYNGLDLTECDAEFRFFWIESRLSESELDKVDDRNEIAFEMIEKYDCGNSEALNEFLSVYPVWPANEPQLDGFLFYHKESSYIQGSTPLVGWLFPFMIPELFDVPCFNESFMSGMPPDYKGYMAFIECFEKQQKNKTKRKKHKRKIQPMETSELDEESIEEIVADTEILETLDN